MLRGTARVTWNSSRLCNWCYLCTALGVWLRFCPGDVEGGSGPFAGRLSGAVAVVTGASRGIGKGICAVVADRAAYAFTVTRRYVAGMAVVSGLPVVFCSLNRVSSSAKSSSARPFEAAASKAFMVGP